MGNDLALAFDKDRNNFVNEVNTYSHVIVALLHSAE